MRDMEIFIALSGPQLCFLLFDDLKIQNHLKGDDLEARVWLIAPISPALSSPIK